MTTTDATHPGCTTAARDAALVIAATLAALDCCTETEAAHLGAYGLVRLVKDIEHDVATIRLRTYGQH